MQFTTLLLGLSASCGLVAASGFSLARDNALPHDGYTITPSNEVPHGSYPISPIPTRSRRRAAGTRAPEDEVVPNWAGIVIKDPPPNEHFIGAFGQFQVPDTKLPENAPDEQYIYSVWVGIDGYVTTPGLFQGGIAFTLKKGGAEGPTLDSDAWVEWIPDPEIGLDGTLPDGTKEFSFNPGDWIQVEVDTDSSVEHPTQGTITITNLNTNQKVARVYHVPEAGYEILGRSVEWIVERTMINSGYATFPDFGEVHFDNCGARTQGDDGSEGRLVDLSEGTPVIAQQGDQLMTSVLMLGGAKEFMLKYDPRHI